MVFSLHFSLVRSILVGHEMECRPHRRRRCRRCRKINGMEGIAGRRDVK